MKMKLVVDRYSRKGCRLPIDLEKEITEDVVDIGTEIPVDVFFMEDPRLEDEIRHVSSAGIDIFCRLKVE